MKNQKEEITEYDLREFQEEVQHKYYYINYFSKIAQENDRLLLSWRLYYHHKNKTIQAYSLAREAYHQYTGTAKELARILMTILLWNRHEVKTDKKIKTKVPVGLLPLREEDKRYFAWNEEREIETHR